MIYLGFLQAWKSIKKMASIQKYSSKELPLHVSYLEVLIALWILALEHQINWKRAMWAPWDLLVKTPGEIMVSYLDWDNN